MALPRNYGGGNPLVISNGLLNRRIYTSIRPSFILENIVRILITNQTAQLAIQTTLDGWDSFPLTIIPTTNFHIGTGRDFNNLACNVIYTAKSTYDDSAVKFTTLEISLIVTVENGIDAFNAYKRADSYITCFSDILDSYFLVAKPELLYNSTTDSYLTTGSIEIAEIDGIGIVNAGNLPGVNKSIGYLPTLRIRIIYQSSTSNQF
jgi:hypothetical protein